MSYDPYNGSYPPKKFYYDGINTLIEKEKFEDTCWRTVLANALKDAPIGQIIIQRRWNYNAVPCGSPTFQSTMTALHYDHIGNVLGTSICDGYTTPLHAYDMDAFGNVKEGNQEGIHLTTKHYDPNSKLYYFGARWYDPAVGQWIQKEPLGLDGPNWYSYVNNNPLYFVDYDGFQMVPIGPNGPVYPRDPSFIHPPILPPRKPVGSGSPTQCQAAAEALSNMFPPTKYNRPSNWTSKCFVKCITDSRAGEEGAFMNQCMQGAIKACEQADKGIDQAGRYNGGRPPTNPGRF